MKSEKPPLPPLRILEESLGGIAAGLLIWTIAWKSTSVQTASIIMIINFILISIALVISVKLIKKSYKIFGIILIIFLVPLVLIALLFGACTALS